MSVISRRQFAYGAALWAGSGGTAATAARAATVPMFIVDPFQLGVASGDPVPDGFVIWTRLAPDPFDPQALPAEAIPVTWDVAHDSAFKKLAASGQVYAQPDLAHSVHVDVRGLEHGRIYYYRFRCGNAVSRAGRAKTLSTPRAPLAKLRFAFASCQHYEQGYFTAYRDMVAQDPDFILHLGDYVYEVSWGTTVRHSPAQEASNLAEYRRVHAVYKMDPDLQAAHAHCPWLMVWDDHEFANDYSRDEAERERDTATFLARRRAAYQAYYEHMPLRASAAPDATGGMLMYQRLNFGDLMEIALLDARQYRDKLPCQEPGLHAGRLLDVAQCAEISDPKRSMLGATQERWLSMGWAKSNATWNVLAQGLMIAGFDQISGPAFGAFTDGWNGYPASRQRLMENVKARLASGAKNFVALGGDIHSYVISTANELVADTLSPALMAEFVTTSVTSESYNTARFQKALPENPHIKFLDDTIRGYTLCDVDQATWRTTLRVVEDVRVRTPKFRTHATFAVENGRPGIQVA